MSNSITTGDEIFDITASSMDTNASSTKRVAAFDTVDDGESQPFGSLLGSGGMTLTGAAGLRATLPTGASTRRTITRAVLKTLSHTYPLSVWGHEAPVCRVTPSIR